MGCVGVGGEGVVVKGDREVVAGGGRRGDLEGIWMVDCGGERVIRFQNTMCSASFSGARDGRDR